MFNLFTNASDKNPVGTFPSLNKDGFAVGALNVFNKFPKIGCIVLLDFYGKSLHAFYRTDFNL